MPQQVGRWVILVLFVHESHVADEKLKRQRDLIVYLCLTLLLGRLIIYRKEIAARGINGMMNGLLSR